MGAFNCSIEVASREGATPVRVDALVDTGATYTVLPSNLLLDLGVTPNRRAEFEFGDGRRVEMDIGDIWITVEGRSVSTRVIFGEDESTYLLGAYALEGVLLGVDPYSERLMPVIGLIK